jgi:rod shape-determining protein MreD
METPRRPRRTGEAVKRVLGLLGLGAVALTLQGAVATFIPARFCPDLGFLLVVALGLAWRSAVGGVCVTAAIGFVTDMLSGSLLGQHALLRLAAYGASRFASRHLNLRGPLPQAAFAAGLTAANAVGLALLTSFFSPGSGTAIAAVRELLPQVAANAVFAPLIAMLTERAIVRLGDEDTGQRLLPLASRGRVA